MANERGWKLQLRSEGGATATVEVDSGLDGEAAKGRAGDWLRSLGLVTPGVDRVSETAWWELVDHAGELRERGAVAIYVAPADDALVRAAGGDPTCHHDWVLDRAYPGDRETVEYHHCRRCGLVRGRTLSEHEGFGEVQTFYHRPDTGAPPY
jgi:hypothetical protein